MKPRNALLCVCTFFIVVLLSACAPKTAPITLTASLSELDGTVKLKPAGQQEFSEATGSSVLEAGGQVQTGDDGRVRLDLSNGTIVRVAPSSLFTLASIDATDSGLNTKLDLQLGEVFIILNGGTMDVETPSGVASVRGSFMGLQLVEVAPGIFDVIVTCLEGDCGAENEAGSADLTDGQRTILFHQDPVTGLYTAPEIGLMTPDDLQHWLDENPEAAAIFTQVANTKTALAPSNTPEPTFTDVPPATDTPQPTDTTEPPTVRPTLRKHPTDEPAPACTIENAQYENPEAACYCDPYYEGPPEGLPSWCTAPQ
ncbi:MAG TPA: FecR family protein [Anaerolineales bacterium]|jgi:hypothetical protein